MITLVGSFIADLTARTPRMPVPGETVLGKSFTLGPGGKGSNQAAAAARCGSKVNLVTKLGDDEFGALALNCFKADGINFEYTLITKDHPTGTALILVDDSGENMIVVTLGACGTISREEVFAAENIIKQSSLVMTQLETSIESVVAAIELANKHGIPVIFNPAPYNADYPREILPMVNYITPNEIEAGHMTGCKITNEKSVVSAAGKIKQMGAGTVIITLGERGCLIYENENDYSFVQAFKVDAVDTTGAGDAFNGGLAHAIEKGMNLKDAVRYASAVAAISVTRFGASTAMPQSCEVDEFLRIRG